MICLRLSPNLPDLDSLPEKERCVAPVACDKSAPQHYLAYKYTQLFKAVQTSLLDISTYILYELTDRMEVKLPALLFLEVMTDRPTDRPGHLSK